MSRLGLIAILCSACGTGPGGSDAGGDSVPQVCLDATMHQDLAWIEANIFVKQCAFSGCHNGAATPQGMQDLRAGMSYAHLVNVTSVLEPTRKLVVPGDPAKSYLLVMIMEIQPQDADPPAGPIRTDVGTMPQGSTLLCVEKRDAIKRWIAAGAMNN
jgi:hypothetical protein